MCAMDMRIPLVIELFLQNNDERPLVAGGKQDPDGGNLRILEHKSSGFQYLKIKSLGF